MATLTPHAQPGARAPPRCLRAGTWWRPSALAATLLPEAATVTVGCCQRSTGVCLDPTALFTPEQGRGEEEPKALATSRPGLHTLDYWQLHLAFNGLNVSLEWAGTGAGQGHDAQQDLTILATVVSGNASDFVLTLAGAFYYDRAGAVEAGAGSWLRLSAHGLRAKVLRAATPAAAPPVAANLSSQPFLELELAAGSAAAATTPTGCTLPAIEAAMAAAREAAVATIPGAVDEGGNLAAATNAMLAGNMWNVIYHPTQLGPFVSVSRSFTLQPYELFEWDTYFGATMLSYDKRLLPIALSSLIQITKSKTLGKNLDGHGFVPGYSKGGRWLSEDRTERPIGAMTLLRIWRRWHGVGGTDLTWAVALVYPDLLDWHRWLWGERRIPPLNLAGVGSDTCFVPANTSSTSTSTATPATPATPALGPSSSSGGSSTSAAADATTAPPPQQQQRWCKPSWGMGGLQGARFESLDNSPMYDAPTGYSMWNATSQRMRLCVKDRGATKPRGR